MVAVSSNFRPDPVLAGSIPVEGVKTVFLSYDWDSENLYTTDLTQLSQMNQFTTIQTIYIDNSSATSSVNIACSTSRQSISLGPGKCGYIPILTDNRTTFIVTSSGSGITKINFLNYGFAASVWDATSSPIVIADPLPVTDSALEALIVSSRFNTRNIESQCTDVDRSGSITIGGTAQTIVAANANRRGLTIQNNDVNYPSEELWICTTGTAVINGSSSFALSAYAAVGYPGGSVNLKSSNAISIIAATTGHKFYCVEW